MTAEERGGSGGTAWPPPDPPLVFTWQGRTVTLAPVRTSRAPVRLLGYEMVCPECGKRSFWTTAIGRPEAEVIPEADGSLTLRTPLVCPFDVCDFAVVVQRGTAFRDRRAPPGGRP